MALTRPAPLQRLRLSPNEEAALISQKREERRIARILQVREQEKALAKQLRENIRGKMAEEKKQLDAHRQTQTEAVSDCQLRQLEAMLDNHYHSIGQGHLSARAVNEEEKKMRELERQLAEEQRARAQARQLNAMQELTENQLRYQQEKDSRTLYRKNALDIERQRAKAIAAAPPQTSPFSLKTHVSADPCPCHGKRERVQGAELFASTYYHLPHNLVEREPAEPSNSLPDAGQNAQLVSVWEEKMSKQAAALHLEQREVAHMRYKHALARVHREQEKEEVMKELGHLERQQRGRRQKALTSMPNNLFQPPQLWMEREAQRQRQLESAFERLLLQTNAAPSHHHSSIPNTSPSPPPPPKSPRTPPPSPHAYPPPSPHSPPVPPHQPSSDDTLTSSTSSKFTDNGAGVQRLLTMIRTQQRAWQDQLTARHQLPPPDDSLSIHTIISTEDGHHCVNTTPTGGIPSVPDYSALSISTLRSSVLSSNEEGNTSTSSHDLPPTPAVAHHTPSPRQPSIHPSTQMTDKSLSLSTLDTNSSHNDSQQQQQQQSWTTIDEEEQRVETRPSPVGLQPVSLVSPSTSPSSVRSPPSAGAPTAAATDAVTPTSSSLSLQEAFLLKKEKFVQQSQRRQEEIGRRATQRQTQQHQISEERKRAEQTSRGERKRAVTFSLPSVSSTSVTSQTQQGTAVRKTVHRKINAKEMRERNRRFYNRLPEVRQQRQLQQRSQEYIDNRERARQFNEKLTQKRKQKKGA